MKAQEGLRTTSAFLLPLTGLSKTPLSLALTGGVCVGGWLGPRLLGEISSGRGWGK